MAPLIDRRSLLLGGSFGLGALAMGGGRAAAALMTATGFTHNVASGEPGPTSVLLWTRYVPAKGEGRLKAEVSDSEAFTHIVSGGQITTRAENDHTAKLTVTGLAPGQWYYYRFIAADGTKSPVGRTRTLPVGPVSRFGIGVFSCANLPFGWFNAYGHAATRGDLDLIVHNGDYIYEYQRGYYPGVEQAVKGRLLTPDNELIQLADYRLRYACYRADADLQKLHQYFPMIAQWDDHEIANDAWATGAENHGPDEGDFTLRKAAAVKAYNEWMPVSGKAWTRYEIGDLATLFRPETRLTARSQRLDLGEVAAGSDNLAADFARLRDGALADPARTLMGAEQESWLFNGLSQSVKRGAKWHVVTQQVIAGQMMMPQLPPSMIDGMKVAPEVARQLKASVAAAKAGLPLSLDNWDGFPAARARFLKAAQAADADLVVLSGDSHNAWAFDLAQDAKPAGVEFAGHSVSSPGFEGYLPLPPQMVAQALMGASPELKWAETSQRGYMAIDLTPERASGEWVFMDTVSVPSLATGRNKTMSAERGRRSFNTSV